MKRLLSLALSLALVAGPAAAQSGDMTPPPAPPPEPTNTVGATSGADKPEVMPELLDTSSRFLLPGNLDTRFTVDTDVLVVYVMVGASADFGLVRLRPGTLAIGAGVDYGFCGSFCLAFNALTPFNMGQSHLFPNVRLTYHFPLPRSGSLTNEKVNVYGLLYAGPLATWWGLKSDDGSVEVAGNDLSFGVGAGVGAQYFFADRLFVGAEATARYARGRYNWRVVVGSYNLTGNEDTWDLSGFNLRLMVGLRLL